MGPRGWAVLMEVLRSLDGLAILNGLPQYRSIVLGALASVDLGGTQLAVALGQFLSRSADTLVSLDLRYCHISVS